MIDYKVDNNHNYNRSIHNAFINRFRGKKIYNTQNLCYKDIH